MLLLKIVFMHVSRLFSFCVHACQMLNNLTIFCSYPATAKEKESASLSSGWSLSLFKNQDWCLCSHFMNRLGGLGWHFCCQLEGPANRLLCWLSTVISCLQCQPSHVKPLQAVIHGAPDSLDHTHLPVFLRSEVLALPMKLSSPWLSLICPWGLGMA